MHIDYTDFMGADSIINSKYLNEWAEIERVLRSMPVHLKASDQANKQGNAIFDPVGTNQYITTELTNSSLGWNTKTKIPGNFKQFGTDVDFVKNGIVVEVQFSNYPFLLNNTIRSELFFRSKTIFHTRPTSLIIIITKSRMFPSSNSTLYYEQSVEQLTTLASQSIFTVPIRLVKLFENQGKAKAIWTDYSASRYSRTIHLQTPVDIEIKPGSSTTCSITVAP